MKKVRSANQRRGAGFIISGLFAGLIVLFSACSGETGSLSAQAGSSCMLCHNGSQHTDYSGPGIENPHPFPDTTPGATVDSTRLDCVLCHGGNPNGVDKVTSHVPPPPQIGDALKLSTDAKAYFNRLTQAGLDKFGDYSANGVTYHALDYLQFINPGDLRVTTDGRGCGDCHEKHSDSVSTSALATQSGIFSGATYAIGAGSAVPENDGVHEKTAADIGFRAVTDANFATSQSVLGTVVRLIEAPVFSVFGDTGPNAIFNNPNYFSAALNDDRNADNTVITGSPLHNLFLEQVSFTCGDCHLGSSGANNRAGDFRSAGCTACHMQYSLGGKSGSTDPNINKLEPVNPDAIQAPERPHTRSHQIKSVAKTLPGGQTIAGIDDYACAGCHQGSNRTVMQYWGIRLDQNADVKNHRQYPANPSTFTTTQNDARLFDQTVNNNTFNGRNANQYVLKEDYDGDGRDDTPMDVHYQAGMGCIDCHGSYDLHGGNAEAGETSIASRMEQQVGIRCESCHGTIESYAATAPGEDYGGTTRDLAMDAESNPLKHVYRDANGRYFLKSRLDGVVHYIPQTQDTIADNAKVHPTTNAPIYNPKASYAMGRIDADPANGMGPLQTGANTQNFSHSDSMDCIACHGSWTNTCMGCHLGGEYNTGNNFSNITGERIVYKQANADFTYQSPIYFQLGVGPRGKITQFSANTKVFYKYEDKNNVVSQVFTFSDRNSAGTNPAAGFGSMSHNSLMAHSVRGKVTTQNEGPRYCTACHLSTESLANYGTEYDTFRTAMANDNYAALDFQFLKQHFGQNTGNQINSPVWAHMAAGLGTGLFLFDEFGAPINPLDTNPNRVGAGGIAPAANFNINRVRLNLDRIVNTSGVAKGSNNHAWLTTAFNALLGANLRDGASDMQLAGPLGTTLIRKLSDPTTGIVLDSWLDADSASHGGATPLVGP
ncbi:MAG TPA: hypothetical protein VK843_00960 [Planctomycetota bacterium]|nr:hypothetical protein [Planctomycetota bacterium]